MVNGNPPGWADPGRRRVCRSCAATRSVTTSTRSLDVLRAALRDRRRRGRHRWARADVRRPDPAGARRARRRPARPRPDAAGRACERWYADRGRVKPPAVDVQAERPPTARGAHNRVGTAPGLGLERRRATRSTPCRGSRAEMRAMLDRRGGAGAAPAEPARHRRCVTRAASGRRAWGSRWWPSGWSPLESALPPGVRLAYLASPGEVRVRFTGTDPDTSQQARAGPGPRAARGPRSAARTTRRLPASVLARARRPGADGRGGGVADRRVRSRRRWWTWPGRRPTLRGRAWSPTRPTSSRRCSACPAELLDAGRRGPRRTWRWRCRRGVRDRAGADWGVATTGVAGPDPQDGVQPGTVHLAVSRRTGRRCSPCGCGATGRSSGPWRR